MAEEPYDVGDRPPVGCNFRDPATAQPDRRPPYLGDPITLAAGSVTATVRDPAGNTTQPTVTQTTFTITHPDTGLELTGTRALIEVSLTKHGTWRVLFLATGAIEAAEETLLSVRERWTKRY